MDRASSRRGATTAGQTLIGMLIVLAIILTATVMYWHRGGDDQDGTTARTVPGRAIEKTESFVCENNLRQIRTAVQMNTMSGDPAPASLQELNYPAETLRCPVGGEAYKYDPKTGKAWCPHPGHEKY